MFNVGTTVKGDHAHAGTLQVLKNLEKLNIIKILKIVRYEAETLYDDMEGYDRCENFEVQIDIPNNNPVDGYMGQDFVGSMLSGLHNVEVQWHGFTMKY